MSRLCSLRRSRGCAVLLYIPTHAVRGLAVIRDSGAADVTGGAMVMSFLPLGGLIDPTVHP